MCVDVDYSFFKQSKLQYETNAMNGIFIIFLTYSYKRLGLRSRRRRHRRRHPYPLIPLRDPGDPPDLETVFNLSVSFFRMIWAQKCLCTRNQMSRLEECMGWVGVEGGGQSYPLPIGCVFR